jgi:acetolactate synthase I/II/III large subunit
MNKQDSKMNGAQALIRCLEAKGVEYIFGYSGGAAIPIFDALVDSKIKLVLVRHEQGAAHMADGYARSTGKPGVVLVTSGPGATNTITGLFTALMDSSPIIVLAGQVPTYGLGKDLFQEADIFGMTAPAVKHSYLVKNTNAIPRIVEEAYYICSTGRPGPVFIDLPKDITSGPYTGSFDDIKMDLPGYKVPGAGNLEKIKEMAKLLKASRRPLLLIGNGVVIAGASEEATALARKLKSPAVTTILGKGGIDETDELCLGFLGMHGTAFANKAVGRCDLILSIGSRWDDRITPAKIERFCPEAKKLHIDIDPAEINKVLIPDVSVIGDAKLVMTELLNHVEACDSSEWLEEVQGNRKKYPLSYKIHGGLKPQHVIDELYKITKGDAVVSVDVGQHQMWAAQFFKTSKPRSWICSGGAGTMGFGMPAAIGAQFARPKDRVICICGDGGFQMTLFELSTIMIHKLPVKILVIDNKYLGMVRQWQELFYENRQSGVDLEGNPDFVKLAEAYGMKAFRIRRPIDVRKTLQKAMDFDGPCLIHAEVIKEDNVFPMIPAGATVNEMILKAPTKAMEKPVGST